MRTLALLLIGSAAALAQSPITESSPVAQSTLSTVSSLTVTGFSCPAGSTIVAFGKAESNGTTFTMSDSASDTYTAVGSPYGFSYGAKPMQGFYSPNIPANITNGTVTVTLSVADSQVVVAARCWTGLGSNVVLDTQASGTYTQSGNNVTGASTTFGFSQVFSTEAVYEGTAYLVIGNAGNDVFTGSNGWSVNEQSEAPQFAAGSQLWTSEQTAAQVSVTSSLTDYGGVIAFSLHAYVAPPPYTVVLNPGTVLWSTPQVPGLNWAQQYQTNYGPGQILRNLLFEDNSSMEGYVQSEVLTLGGGSTTTFLDANDFNTAPQNFFVGGTFNALVAANSGAQGCTGTIASHLTGNDFANGGSGSTASTGVTATYNSTTGYATYTSNNNSIDWSNGQTVTVHNMNVPAYEVTGVISSVSSPTWQMYLGTGLSIATTATGAGVGSPAYAGRNMLYTFSTPCGAALQSGDVVSVSVGGTEGVFTSTSGNIPYAQTTLNHGATAQFATGDVPPGNGAHALKVDASAASNASGSFGYYADATVAGASNSVLMNGGQWTASVWAKVTSCTGTCTFTLAVVRGSGSWTSGAFTPTVTATANSGWQQFIYNFAPAETSSTGTNAIVTTVATAGQGVFLFKNISLSQTGGLNAANTTAFRDQVYAAAQLYHPGTLRYWDGQLGETLDNWIVPSDGAQRSGYSPSGVGAYASNNPTVRIADFLNMCVAANADPWIVIPLAWSPATAANFVDYLFGGSGTTYGAKRIAYGQTATWGSLFHKIHIEYGDEPWNYGFSGGNQPNYTLYGKMASALFGAMKADASYSNKLDLILACQQVGSGTCMTAHGEDAYHDSISISGYDGLTLTNYDHTTAYSNVLGDAWGFSNDLTQGAGRQYATAIAGSGRVVPVEIYEDATNVPSVTVSASASLANAAEMDASLGAALAEAVQELEVLKRWNVPQQKWNLSQFADTISGSNGSSIKGPLWGIAIDYGGVTGRVRPQFYAHQMVNNAIIGPMFSTSWLSNPTYSTVAQNGVPSYANVPTMLSYAFLNGNTRSAILINTSTTAAQTFAWGGIAPLGTGTQTVLNSTNISDGNESAAVVAPVTSSITFGTTYTVPAHALVVLTWTSSIVSGYPWQLTGSFVNSGAVSLQ